MLDLSFEVIADSGVLKDASQIMTCVACTYGGCFIAGKQFSEEELDMKLDNLQY